jgi:hypothetical protein
MKFTYNVNTGASSDIVNGYFNAKYKILRILTTCL